ncbi:MAG: GatB/YqeY domain-containing protein, partial [Clostridia bacterium]
LMSEGRVNSSTGKKILSALFDTDCDPQTYAAEHELFTLTDEGQLNAAVEKVLAQNPDMVASFRAGRTNAERALMGKAMAETRGKADAERLNALLHARLSQADA